MTLSIGIVGLPNAGKSTLFSALTPQSAEIAGYPFTTIDPNVGKVPVPDPRLERVGEIVQPETLVPADVSFVDIAGLVKGASHGEGLGNQFLGHIRDCDAICEVLRSFSSGEVAHVAGKIDPLGDAETLETEMVLADLDTLEKATKKLEKAAQSDKSLRPRLQAVDQTRTALENGRRAREAGLTPEQQRELRDLNLLTLKPFLYLLNVDEEEAASEPQSLEGAETLALCASLEAELAELDTEEQREFLAGMGLAEPGLNRLIRAAYRLLGLITFFSTQSGEVRAWTIRQGATAPEAAGAIHSDFQDGFIKAEVTHFPDLDMLGSETEVKAAGRLHIEGKDYVVEDGDVMRFRFKA